ncbi:MAG: hypothetical protein EU535_06370 [Promethearchaeota archaeon]|nr:MAG: hypothetical protein EU535_06370 [Candidatus Lokiarchaeota archaeon]
MRSLLGGGQHQESQMDDLISLMMVQQLFKDNHASARSPPRQKNRISHREQELDAIKNEILDLFEEEL